MICINKKHVIQHMFVEVACHNLYLLSKNY